MKTLSERHKAFLAEYAELVRRHGIVWGYDSGHSTPTELWTVPIAELTQWLEKLEQGEIEGFDIC